MTPAPCGVLATGMPKSSASRRTSGAASANTPRDLGRRRGPAIDLVPPLPWIGHGGRRRVFGEDVEWHVDVHGPRPPRRRRLERLSQRERQHLGTRHLEGALHVRADHGGKVRLVMAVRLLKGAAVELRRGHVPGDRDEGWTPIILMRSARCPSASIRPTIPWPHRPKTYGTFSLTRYSAIRSPPRMTASLGSERDSSRRRRGRGSVPQPVVIPATDGRAHGTGSPRRRGRPRYAPRPRDRRSCAPRGARGRGRGPTARAGSWRRRADARPRAGVGRSDGADGATARRSPGPGFRGPGRAG